MSQGKFHSCDPINPIKVYGTRSVDLGRMELLGGEDIHSGGELMGGGSLCLGETLWKVGVLGIWLS